MEKINSGKLDLVMLASELQKIEMSVIEFIAIEESSKFRSLLLDACNQISSASKILVLVEMDKAAKNKCLSYDNSKDVFVDSNSISRNTIVSEDH